MNIFDEVDENLFRPLTGINKRKYSDIITLIWDRCKRMPMYAIEKSTIIDMVEEYIYGLGEDLELDEDEKNEVDNTSRGIALGFLRKLKDTGWILEKNGEYEEEQLYAVNYKVVPIIKSFLEIVNPKIITYKGKLFKIYSMFEHITAQGSPYEGVLKEASEDFDNLNQALRILAASIEDHINELTLGRTPQQILELFATYEEKIVVGSYHRFKTQDNLFYYRTSLLESLDKCEDVLFDALVNDYMEVERVDNTEARYKIKELILKIRMDIEEMENIMRTIDDKHILYRTRAVSRAEFLLLSDGSVKSKINKLLQYYATTINQKDDINQDDDTEISKVFQIFGQNYFDYNSLAAPIKRRKPTKIGTMAIIEALDENIVKEKRKEIYEYIKNAITPENVNVFAQSILKDKQEVYISKVFKDNPDDIIKIIGLSVYSKSKEREYDKIRLNEDEFVNVNGFRFKDFKISRRKG